MIPQNVITETLLTLNMLYTKCDTRTERYLENNDRGIFNETFINAPKPLSFSDIFHWQDRLAEFHHQSQSSPTTWSQMWTDRRNPLQRYTF